MDALREGLIGRTVAQIVKQKHSDGLVSLK
jgi:hypothetical protein